MLIIGKVLKPHGVRGGLKVKSFMDTPYIFSEIKNIFIAEIEYKIEKVQPSANFVILQLEGINSIEDAEKFRNAEIFLKKEQAPKLPKGRYYIDELLGCDIYINDEKVGKLRDIIQSGAADIYCVEGKKKFMFPYVGDVIENIDIANKKILLDKSQLEKVAVYED